MHAASLDLASACVLPLLQHNAIKSHQSFHTCVQFLLLWFYHLILFPPSQLCDFQMDAIPFTFSNLKSLELSTDISDMHHISLMFCLLRSSPNLEKLKIEVMLAWTTFYSSLQFLKVILLIIPTDFSFYIYWLASMAENDCKSEVLKCTVD
jgi:hypothetical protein